MVVFAAALLIWGCDETSKKSELTNIGDDTMRVKTPEPLTRYPADQLDCRVVIYGGYCSDVGSQVKSVSMVKTDGGCTEECTYEPAGGDVTLNEGSYAVVVLFSTTAGNPTLPLATDCQDVTIEGGMSEGVSFDTYDTTGQPAYAQALIASLDWFDYDNDGLSNIDDPDPWASQNFKVTQPAFPGHAQAGPVDSAGNNFRMKAFTIGQTIQGEADAGGNFKMKAGQAYLAK